MPTIVGPHTLIIDGVDVYGTSTPATGYNPTDRPTDEAKARCREPGGVGGREPDRTTERGR